MGWFTFGDDAGPRIQMRRIERKLDAIMAHLGIGLSSDTQDDIRAPVAAGRKIEAIREYRERTGAGLAEAKRSVESGL